MALDPAVGSGAFPMGMPHKLVHILSRADPQNAKWKKIQQARAAEIPDPAVRRDALENIGRVFSEANNYGDYGRKLYLIQRVIHGADLQPAAAQIARLRFFISLVIDQKPREDRPNRGIEPLPNLETKFVAADSLVGLSRPEGALQDPAVEKLLPKIDRVRRDYFGAKTRAEKHALKQEDARLRGQLAAALKKGGDWGVEDANRFAEWDVYDQTGRADWFDAEFMLGVHEGFDIVIGNPPYLESRNSAFSGERKAAYQRQAARDWPPRKDSPIPRGADLLVYFLPRAVRELKHDGTGVFIVQNSWLHADYGRKFQRFALDEFSVFRVVDSAFRHFVGADAPSVNTVITFLSPKRGLPLRMRSMKNWGDVAGAEKIFSAEKLRSSEWKWGVLFESPPWLVGILDSLRANRADKRGVPVFWGQGINEPQDSYLTAEDAAFRFGVGADKLHPVFFRGACFEFAESEFFLLRAANLEKSELANLRKKQAPIFVDGDRREIPDLILPRGLGRHYCALNRAGGFSYSGVECRMSPEWRERAGRSVWALMNSSLIWLYREISGRKNLGGGMLKAEATDMKQLGERLRIPDMESGARKIFESIRHREPLSPLEEIETPEHRATDALVCRALGCEEYEGRIRSALREAIAFRENKARTG